MALQQAHPGDVITAAIFNGNTYSLLKGVSGSEDTITLADNVAGTLLLKPTVDPAATTHLFQIQNAAGTEMFYIEADGTFRSNGSPPVIRFDEEILAAPATSVTLTVGVGTYHYLRVLGFYRTDPTPGVGPILPYLLKVRVNGDSGANYDSYIYEQSSASSGSSLAATSMALGWADTATNGANIFAAFDMLIPSYLSTTRNKSFQASSSFVDTSSSAGISSQATGLWNSTAAITSISILSGTGNFLADTVFTLLAIP